MKNANRTVRGLIQHSRRFEAEAHEILGIHEGADSRVVLLDKTYTQLAALSVRQDELFRQALRCIESKLFRAAHVMAWAAFMDFLEERLAAGGFKNLWKIRPKWKVPSVEQLRETVPESQIIDAGHDLGLYDKNARRALQGLLAKRNECAHPSSFFPQLNETLGYVSELLQRLDLIRAK